MRRCLAVAVVLLLGACTSSEPNPPDEVKGSTVAPRSVTASWFKTSCQSPNRHIELINRGYYPGRSPDVTMTPKEPSLFATETGTTHSGPWPYTQDIPIVLYGPGFIEPKGTIELDRESTIADIAPTIAELVDTPFPEDRPGRAITEALTPDAGRPKLVVVIVWDGGGWNVLKEWPDAWPFLKSRMEKATSIKNAIVGSSPSVTPAVHASLGTGAWPNQHGLVDIWLRRGEVTGDSFENLNPRNLAIPTLADLYDQAEGNEPLIGMFAAEGWHLGMIGHGSAMEGGDKDIAVLENEQIMPTTNTKYYSMPDYLDMPATPSEIRAVDSADGAVDNRWLGHYVLAEPEDQPRSPVRPLQQTRQLKALIEREGFGADDVPDLLFTNYKSIDLVGHSFNMVNPEMESILEWTDKTLKDLVRFLNDEVGKNEWVLALTADHGQGPSTESTGGYPIDVLHLKSHVAEQMGFPEGKLFDRWRPTGYWLEQDLRRRGAKASEVADHIAGYRAVDAADGGPLHETYDGPAKAELFESAFPMDRIDEVLACTAES